MNLVLHKVSAAFNLAYEKIVRECYRWMSWTRRFMMEVKQAVKKYGYTILSSCLFFNIYEYQCSVPQGSIYLLDSCT